MKILLSSYPVFDVGFKAFKEFLDLKNIPYHVMADEIFEGQFELVDMKGSRFRYEDYRSDSLLVAIVEKLGADSNPLFGELRVIEVPDDVEWIIQSCEGSAEWIAEKHRTWH